MDGTKTIPELSFAAGSIQRKRTYSTATGYGARQPGLFNCMGSFSGAAVCFNGYRKSNTAHSVWIMSVGSLNDFTITLIR